MCIVKSLIVNSCIVSFDRQMTITSLNVFRIIIAMSRCVSYTAVHVELGLKYF